MQIRELTFGFIASYIAGVLPSLNEIRSEVDKKTLQDHVENCFDVALKRWYSNSTVRERIALRKFSSINQLQECYKGDDWKQYKYIIKSFLKTWADELHKDFDCVSYIQQYDIPEQDEHLKSLIEFLGEDVVLQTILIVTFSFMRLVQKKDVYWQIMWRVWSALQQISLSSTVVRRRVRQLNYSSCVGNCNRANCMWRSAMKFVRIRP